MLTLDAVLRGAVERHDVPPTLDAAFVAAGVHLVTVPIDYSENTRVFVEELGEGQTTSGWPDDVLCDPGGLGGRQRPICRELVPHLLAF